MALYKYSQADWKFPTLSFVVCFLTYQLLLKLVGFGVALFLSLAIEVIILVFFTKYFKSVAEFHDSYLLVKKGFSNKTEKIPYSEFQKISYSNATRFLKLNLYTNGNKLELPPPARLAQAKELFAWLQIKNPAIAFEITQPEPALD
ncbi:hypothetical protein [Adhaeribacter radiodurans]|uniref:PH domain-containing protein n=1 Tax=Adhaeribacter radiodurans TaxID=2745197 RepID=A0A7L7LAT0_9BACT|nr:hypothetical protein [Adhaeribacter radiodurans]QMU29942.1 hypothetical protein HUW48_18770 [Adhaeribacter radiodurans]